MSCEIAQDMQKKQELSSTHPKSPPPTNKMKELLGKCTIGEITSEEAAIILINGKSKPETQEEKFSWDFSILACQTMNKCYNNEASPQEVYIEIKQGYKALLKAILPNANIFSKESEKLINNISNNAAGAAKNECTAIQAKTLDP